MLGGIGQGEVEAGGHSLIFQNRFFLLLVGH
jgi:hypothetical protein